MDSNNEVEGKGASSGSYIGQHQQQQQSISYKIGDRVITYNDEGTYVAGTVKWIDAETGIETIVGIETDLAIEQKSFSRNVSGKYSYSTASGNKKKDNLLFLPCHCLLKEEASNSLKNKDEYLTKRAIKTAKKHKESPETLKEQAPAVEMQKIKLINAQKKNENDIDDTISHEEQQNILDHSEIEQEYDNKSAPQTEPYGRGGQVPHDHQGYSYSHNSGGYANLPNSEGLVCQSDPTDSHGHNGAGYPQQMEYDQLQNQSLDTDYCQASGGGNQPPPHDDSQYGPEKERVLSQLHPVLLQGAVEYKESEAELSTSISSKHMSMYTLPLRLTQEVAKIKQQYSPMDLEAEQYGIQIVRWTLKQNNR